MQICRYAGAMRCNAMQRSAAQRIYNTAKRKTCRTTTGRFRTRMRGRKKKSNSPSFLDATPSCMLLMQSLKRDCACRSRWYDCVRCSSSCDRRDCSCESCCVESVVRSICCPCCAIVGRGEARGEGGGGGGKGPNWLREKATG